MADELSLFGAMLGEPDGYHLVRDTRVTDVLPWRVLEFERD